MTKRMGILMAASALAVSALISSAWAGETIKLTTQEWAPYQTVTGGQVDGLAVKAVKCVMEKMGNTAEIVVLPWARAQKDVQDGAAHGFFAASKAAERDQYADMSIAFIPQIWRWYTGNDKAVDVTNKGVKVGVQAGSAMEKWLTDNGYAGIQKTQSADALVKMLQSGRVEAVLANEIVFKDAQATAGIADAFKSTVHSDRPMGVYFSKTFLASHAGFMDAFNAQAKSCQ